MKKMIDLPKLKKSLLEKNLSLLEKNFIILKQNQNYSYYCRNPQIPFEEIKNFYKETP